MNKNPLDEYIKEAKRIEEDSLYSSKGHYNAAADWQRVHFWTGIPNCILAAIAGLSAFEGATVLAGTLGILVASITASITFLNPEAKSSSHKNAATEYHSLRNRARIFINITTKKEVSDDELSGIFDELANQRENLNTISPQIPEKAFLKARTGIESGEADHKD